MLEGLGVASSKHLTQTMLDEAMKHFEKLGFAPKRKFYRPAGSKQRLLWKVAAILKELKRGDDYADSIAGRMFKNDDGQPVRSYRWLDARQLHSLVASLTYHQKRKRKRQS